MVLATVITMVTVGVTVTVLILGVTVAAVLIAGVAIKQKRDRTNNKYLPTF
ncbi:hypothetical protein AB0758_49180 [Tolypothrix bouteillei VB521301_2]|uniref:hypothetical protein n=1 Tax=Tolypothrix bouteillei TaxID=1246981 RepID=UPI0013875203